jgi:hypothetical protein
MTTTLTLLKNDIVTLIRDNGELIFALCCIMVVIAVMLLIATGTDVKNFNATSVTGSNYQCNYCTTTYGALSCSGCGANNTVIQASEYFRVAGCC